MVVPLHFNMARNPRLAKHMGTLRVGVKIMSVEECSFQPLEHCTSAKSGPATLEPTQDRAGLELAAESPGARASPARHRRRAG